MFWLRSMLCSCQCWWSCWLTVTVVEWMLCASCCNLEPGRSSCSSRDVAMMMARTLVTKLMVCLFTGSTWSSQLHGIICLA